MVPVKQTKSREGGISSPIRISSFLFDKKLFALKQGISFWVSTLFWARIFLLFGRLKPFKQEWIFGDEYTWLGAAQSLADKVKIRDVVIRDDFVLLFN